MQYVVRMQDRRIAVSPGSMGFPAKVENRNCDIKRGQNQIAKLILISSSRFAEGGHLISR